MQIYEVKIKRDEIAKKYPLPRTAKAGDVGYDLCVTKKVEIMPGRTVDIPTGIKIQCPINLWARITHRSSTPRKRGLLVTEGVIDSGFRGELCVSVLNPTNKPIMVEEGDRLAQIIFHERILPEFNEVDELDSSMRGETGFGSTDTK